MPDLTIALPVKDGQARLREALEQVRQLVAGLGRPCEVVVVDDGSTDDTPKILAEMAADFPELRVVTHEVNRGKGAALKTAVAASTGDYVLTVDADATYSLDVVDQYLAALEQGAGAAIGNRHDRRTRYVLHPVHFGYIGMRHAVGRVFGMITQLIVGLDVKDPQAGFKAYRGDVARELFPQVQADGFVFDVEILALLRIHDQRIAQLPLIYIFHEQPSSVSLVRHGSRMIAQLLRIRSMLKKRRREAVAREA